MPCSVSSDDVYSHTAPAKFPLKDTVDFCYLEVEGTL